MRMLCGRRENNLAFSARIVGIHRSFAGSIFTVNKFTLSTSRPIGLANAATPAKLKE